MRRIIHLGRRFFESIRSRPLDPREQDRVSGWLREGESRLFWRQQEIDQRHALGCADLIASRNPERLDLIRAALLHDVGKRHARLGVIGRVLASVLWLLHLGAPGRLGLFLDHGALGARELASLGAEPIVTAFAAGHHGSCPAGLSEDDWAVLREADGE
ncbi:MAG: HDIG domain-containing protein [Acidimicrobiia bacterium]|nr:HDIG domain-containing protein [Acidimicrobiia bacterium]